MQTDETNKNLREEYKEWLAAQCNQLIYTYPCRTLYCVKRGEGKATCIPFEIHKLLSKDEEDVNS